MGTHGRGPQERQPHALDLVGDVLDRQLVDREGILMGRVDGLVLSLEGDGPPQVEAVAEGFVVLAARVHPLAERLVHWLRRWTVRRTARYLVPWEKVLEVTPHHVRLDLQATGTPPLAWERFLSRRVVARVPGEREHPGDGEQKGKL